MYAELVLTDTAAAGIILTIKEVKTCELKSLNATRKGRRIQLRTLIKRGFLENSTFGAPIKYPEEVQAHSIGIRSSSILATVFEAGTQLEASAVGSNSKKELHGFTTPVPVSDSTLNVRCLTMPGHHITQDATTRFLCSRVHFNFQETLLWTQQHRHMSIRLLMTFLL